jgi:hypothetical protein
VALIVSVSIACSCGTLLTHLLRTHYHTCFVLLLLLQGEVAFEGCQPQLKVRNKCTPCVCHSDRSITVYCSLLRQLECRPCCDLLLVLLVCSRTCRLTPLYASPHLQTTAVDCCNKQAGDKTYNLLQIHFHSSAEHLMSGYDFAAGSYTTHYCACIHTVSNLAYCSQSQRSQISVPVQTLANPLLYTLAITSEAHYVHVNENDPNDLKVVGVFLQLQAEIIFQVRSTCNVSRTTYSLLENCESSLAYECHTQCIVCSRSCDHKRSSEKQYHYTLSVAST